MNASATALTEGARRLGVQIDHRTTTRQGHEGKSLGGGTTDGMWLRVSSRPSDTAAGSSWFGDEAAAHLSGVAKPSLIASARWLEGSTIWRADLMSRAHDGPLSDTPEILTFPRLGARWWKELDRSLDALRAARTDRVNVRQDLVNRRIAERFGDIGDVQIGAMVVGHGDLHWANLHGPTELTIVDWEGWGLLPNGLDEAYLLAFSLPLPELAREVQNRYRDRLEQRDGILSQLFAVAELLRMNEQYGDSPALRPHLEELGRSALEAWQTHARTSR